MMQEESQENVAQMPNGECSFKKWEWSSLLNAVEYLRIMKTIQHSIW